MEKAGAIFMLAAVSLLTACANTKSDPREVSSLSGVEMYERLCASCHGIQGHGDGPVAPLIKGWVPDLTRVAARDGGEFPTEDVRRTIDGRFERRAHGPRDMPVWGWQFYSSTATNDVEERARVNQTINRLVEYLQSIQRE